MELTILKNRGQKQEPERKSYPITDYKTLLSSSSLLVVESSKMNVEHGANALHDHHNIFKVQYIASCEIAIAKAVIVAFYFKEDGELSTYVLSGLPNDHVEESDGNRICIDYKSYVEICEFTSEKVLSIGDYILQVKGGSLGVNSLLAYNKTMLNSDGQQVMWQMVDDQQAALN